LLLDQNAIAQASLTHNVTTIFREKWFSLQDEIAKDSLDHNVTDQDLLFHNVTPTLFGVNEEAGR